MTMDAFHKKILQKHFKQLFWFQRAGARKRGIDFQFTYEVWVGWWEANLGPDWYRLRGIRQGQYVMARKNDIGPYHPNNVECLTCSQNIFDSLHKEGKRKKYFKGGGRKPGQGHKLTAEEVRFIYKSKQTQKALAVEFFVSERLVRLIKKKQVWQTALS